MDEFRLSACLNFGHMFSRFWNFFVTQMSRLAGISVTRDKAPISAPSRGPVTRDPPNNSKWYSILYTTVIQTEIHQPFDRLSFIGKVDNSLVYKYKTVVVSWWKLSRVIICRIRIINNLSCTPFLYSILHPCYLSFELGHSKQKNNITIDTVETPLSCNLGSRK